MHSDEYNGIQFHYNGDYSGDIKITLEDGTELTKTLQELAVTALYDNLELPFTQAARTLVAFAAVREGISRLEQMEPDEILANPWLTTVLGEITTS